MKTTILDSIKDLLESDQDDEATLVMLVVTPQHLKYYKEDYDDDTPEWENQLSDGKEIGYVLNNEKTLVVYITTDAEAPE